MPAEQENYQKLKAFALVQGVSLFGVADITSIQDTFSIEPKGSIASLSRGVCVAIRLSDAVLDSLVDRPTLLYKHHYREANELLDTVAFRVANLIEQWGCRAMPIAASQIIDWRRQSSHVSHKKVAVLAGLGWLGRNNLLVTPRYGARIRLVTVLTDLPLKVDEPLQEDCASCRDCLTVCPAGAIHEKQEEFDHQACFEQVRHFAKKENIGYYICGLCVKACKGRDR
ncbi:epoxyqueuosine reductase [bacterium]|nr:epoxyqueuosine reductase [bacterium]